MRWVNALRGIAEVLYPVSLSPFQWAYISNVNTCREKTRFALECSLRQMLRKAFRKLRCSF